jgi:hypothetical protein
MGKLARGLVAAVLASATFAGTAYAVRRIPAWSGRPEWGGHIGCMNIASNFLSNGCGEVLYYQIALPYENGGSKTLTVTINSLDTDSDCSPVDFDLSTGYNAGPGVSVTAPNTFQTMTTAAMTVTQGHQFFADCRLSAGARMTSVSYQQ